MGKVKEWRKESPRAAAIRADEQRAAATPANPFDPRTEVSADEKYVVRNLVLWFLALPAFLGFLVWGLPYILKLGLQRTE
jgi:hypothetical protein